MLYFYLLFFLIFIYYYYYNVKKMEQIKEEMKSNTNVLIFTQIKIIYFKLFNLRNLF